MPEKFTAMFAERLNSLCKLEVREAQNGDRVMPGRALIAPGGRHMMLRRSGAQYYVEVADGPLVNRHKPSVDVLFQSAARCGLRGAVAVVLTGMGGDGADGVAALKSASPTWCIAQNAETCAVYGMPQAVASRGLDDESLALSDIGPRLNRIFRV
jgi:two-component system chemotaxis response regulator CheB